MMDLFFYSTLRDDALLQVVLGRGAENIEILQGELTGHRVICANDGKIPMLVADEGGVAKGGLVKGLNDEQIARLNFYQSRDVHRVQEVSVQANGLSYLCQIYLHEDVIPTAEQQWNFSDWQRDWGALSRKTAQEAMSYYGEMTADDLLWQFPRLCARADSKLRAQEQPAPITLRSGMTWRDVSTEVLEHSHHGFYALDTMHLRHNKFDGTNSELLRREVFKSSDATIVLPYDPAIDQILMVEQFRMGPTGRGDPVPWCLEPVAGLIDPGEDPEETAHREAWEEAGVKFTTLETVASGYSSPGASTGYFFLYIGLCDLSEHNSDQTGILDEGEDIRSHIIGFDHAMKLVDTGEINVLPTILCLNWLARHRSRLRGVA